jgi:hypothetical protein
MAGSAAACPANLHFSGQKAGGFECLRASPGQRSFARLSTAFLLTSASSLAGDRAREDASSRGELTASHIVSSLGTAAAL